MKESKYELLRQWYWILKSQGVEIPVSNMKDIRIFRSAWVSPGVDRWPEPHKEKVLLKLKDGRTVIILRETQCNKEFSLESSAWVTTSIKEVNPSEVPDMWL